MYKRHDGYFNGFEDETLFFQTWEKENAKGTILITHGQGEHSEAYHRLVNAFDQDCWNFWAWDLRGHGNSYGKRGYAANFEDYIKDYQIFLKQFFSNPNVSSKPVVLLGHSMGGLIQLKTLIENPDLQNKIQGQVLSAPLLGVAVPVPPAKDAAAKILYHTFPTVTLWNELDNSLLSRDMDILKEFELDAKRHNRISSGVYLGFMNAMKYVHPRASVIQCPTLFQLPLEDKVVSTPASERFYAGLGSSRKKLLTYGDGACHEMYNDTHRKTVYADLRTYLNDLIANPRSPT